jgi:putative methyltransferase (TIGR04325 family)
MDSSTPEGSAPTGHIWFRGNYATWQEARRASAGYDSPSILEKVRAATLKVIAGEAACERDSVAFDRIEYSLPLLASLLYVASRLDNRLHVADFGGSLGTSYWQNRGFLSHLRFLRWSVVEQEHFVRVGQAEVANEVLRFHLTAEACLTEAPVDALLLSSVLQYLEHPFDTLGSLFSLKVPFVIFDRTAFFVDDLPDRLTVEEVPPEIYQGSYPAWFFNLARFRSRCSESGYRIIEEFDSWERWSVDGLSAQNKCFLLEALQRR